MKTTVRIFAFAVVVAGFAAAATTHSSHLRASHLSAASALPAPILTPSCYCSK